MPEISQATLVHWCVVWQRVDTKTRKGQPRVSSPVDMRCRWNVYEQSLPSQDTTTEAYPRTVMIGQDVALGSYIWGQGRIRDLPDNPTYFEVIGVQRIDDIKGRHTAYTVTLQKASTVLPEIV